MVRLKSSYFLITLITLTALVLRFYNLGDWSFWKDEILTLRNQPDGLHLAFLGESFVTYLVQWTITLLGTSEWSARIMPAFIGTLTVPVLFFPIRSLFGQEVAVLSSALLTVSPWHIYWSQNARFYVLLMAFSALSLLTLTIGLEKRRPWLTILAVVFLFMAARESLVALFLVPIIICYFLALAMTSTKSTKLWRDRNSLIVLAILVIVGVYFAAPYLKDLPGWLTAFGRINNSPAWIFAATAYYVTVPIMCLGVFSAYFWVVRRERTVYMLVLWAILPLVAVMALSLFHYTATRYIFLSLPAWTILAAMAAQQVWLRTRQTHAILAAGLIAILIFTSLSQDALYFTYQNGNRDNGRAAYTFIRENWQQNDLVVSSDPEVGDYYMETRVVPMPDMNPEQFGRYQRIWFVENNDGGERYPEQMVWIRRHANQVASFDVYASARIFKMRVYLYEVVNVNSS